MFNIKSTATINYYSDRLPFVVTFYVPRPVHYTVHGTEQRVSWLTVADGVGEVSDVVGVGQHAVAGRDDHVVLMREACDGGQHVAVEPRLGGQRQERDASSTSLGRLQQRPLTTVGVAVCEDDRHERNSRPPVAAQRPQHR